METIFSLADLRAWARPGPALGIIGHPIAHSLSPAMQNAALAELAKGDPQYRDWRYHKFDILPEDLPEALRLFHRLNFRGLNLTVPHKTIAVEHLVAGDAFMRAAGAANTLRWQEDGWRGANTDGRGFSAAVREELGLGLGGQDVILLGAGGAARAVAVECLRQQCRSLWVGNRTPAKLEQMLGHLRAFSLETPVQGFDLAQPPAGLPAGALLVNATSLGLDAADPAPLDLAGIPAPGRVYDMIYRPARTPLLRRAAELGLPHANGLGMLVHQGAQALRIWTGVEPPLAVMQAAARAALAAA